MSRSSQARFWRLSRAGGGQPNPQHLTQRARAFTAAGAGLGSVTLLTVRDGSALSNWLVTPAGAASADAAINLAQAVAARADEVQIGPELDAPVVGYLRAVSASATRDTQAGTDPAEVSRRLAAIMRPGSWVGVSMRPPSKAEVRRSHRWYEHRLGSKMPTHHAFDDGAVIVSVYAGGRSAEDVKSLLEQFAAVLPGFDVSTKARVASPHRPVFTAAFLAAALFAAVLYLTRNPWLANAAGALPALVALGIASGRISTEATRLAASTAEGTLPRPAKRMIAPRKPNKANPNAHAGSKQGRDSEGSYPLAADSYLVGPTVMVGLVAPHAGAASGATMTDARTVPATLTGRIGPSIGVAGSAAEPIHLPADSAYAGIALLGSPGSGKSLLLRAVFGWACLERKRPTGNPGWPGVRNAIVAFESKGDGAEMYQRWATAAGDKTVVVQVADPSSYAIDLFAVPGSASEKASWFTNAMIYAFGEGAIQDRSFETLQAVLTGGIAVTPEVAVEAGLPGNQGPLWYAFVLLGGQGDTKGTALAAAIAAAGVEAERKANAMALGDGGSGPVTASTDLGVASEKLAPMYGTTGGKVTESQRRNLTEAARNKVGQLLALDSWWSTTRRSVTWDQVLDGHRSLIINTGVTTSGQIVDDKLSAQMSSLLMYGLKSAIQRRCSGWQDAGRSVTIFADELSLVAGASPEVVAWLRNQGRSYGVRPVFATQYPEQLPREVRTAFMSFGTLIAFGQQNAAVVAEIVADLSLGGDEWVPSDISGMEPFSAAVRTAVAGHRQPTVVVKVTPFEMGLTTDPAGTFADFAAKQGWT